MPPFQVVNISGCQYQEQQHVEGRSGSTPGGLHRAWEGTLGEEAEEAPRVGEGSASSS